MWVCRVVRIFVVSHCLLELAFLARRETSLGHPFDANPWVDRVLVCVRRHMSFCVGHGVVYPTGWLPYFLILGALGPPHQIRAVAFTSGSSLCGNYRRICLWC